MASSLPRSLRSLGIPRDGIGSKVPRTRDGYRSGYGFCGRDSRDGRDGSDGCGDGRRCSTLTTTAM